MLSLLSAACAKSAKSTPAGGKEVLRLAVLHVRKRCTSVCERCAFKLDICANKKDRIAHIPIDGAALLENKTRRSARKGDKRRDAV